MEDFAASQGLTVNRNSMRSQMAIYHGQGLVESRGNGVWALADAGRTKIGLGNGSAGLQPEGPAPSTTFKNRDEPESVSSARFDLLNPDKAAVPGGGT